MSDPQTPSDEDEHVIHDHPVPPEELGRYSPERDGALEADIANYVLGQARDEEVLHVERIKTEYVLGEAYEIWDVTTDQDRWWVLTNITNLYSQKHFPSMDYTLSFHIGLMMRLRSRDRGPDADDPSPFDEVLRREEQVHDRMDGAVEAEDFQSVGMLLRETLLSLSNAVRRRVDTTDTSNPPQAANFKDWMDLLIGKLCAGSSNEELRKFLRTNCEAAWRYVNWLTHARNADQRAAIVAMHSVELLIGHFVHLTARAGSGNFEVCPNCTSRNMRSHFDPVIGSDGEYYSTCGSCGWSNHPEVQEA